MKNRIDNQTALDNQTAIDCDHFETRIQQLLDDRAALDDAQLVDHASNCVACLEVLNDFRQLIGSMNLRSLDGSGTNKTKHELARQPLANIDWFVVRWLTLAAGLLVIAGIFPTNQPSASRYIAVAPALTELANESTPQSISPVSATGNSTSVNSINEALYQYRPTLYTLAVSTPRLVDAVGIPTASSWERLSGNLEPMNPYWQLSTELPGVRPIKNSVQVTLDLLHRSLQRPGPVKLDLGRAPESIRHFVA